MCIQNVHGLLPFAAYTIKRATITALEHLYLLLNLKIIYLGLQLYPFP